METLIIWMAVFILALAGLVILREKTGGKFEVQNSDIVLAFVIVGLGLFLTGEIQELTFGDVKVVSRIQDASKVSVELQISKLGELPIENIRVDPKIGVQMIPELIRKKTEALSFRLGGGIGYWGPAISEHIQGLIGYSFFRYIIITESDGGLFGMMNAQQFNNLTQGHGEFNIQDFASMLNSSDVSRLRQMPGLMLKESALTKQTNKQNALKQMDSLDMQTLPVIDEKGKLIGIVDRSKLTASMLVDIVDKLSAKK